MLSSANTSRGKSVNTPKKHHLVAQMVLRRFCDPAGRLYVFNKRAPGLGFAHKETDATFFERHLYTATAADQTHDVTLEKEFAKKESGWNHTIGKIVAAAKSGSAFDPADIASLGEFFYYQWIRTPDFLRGLNSTRDATSILTKALARIESEGRLSDADKAELSKPESLARIKQNAIVTALSNAQTVALSILKACNFRIAVLSGPQEFVIGSYPVAFVVAQGQAIVAAPAMELWLPIASNVAVYPDTGASSTTVTPMSDARAIEINRVIANQSTLVGASTAGTLEQVIALAKPTP